MKQKKIASHKLLRSQNKISIAHGQNSGKPKENYIKTRWKFNRTRTNHKASWLAREALGIIRALTAWFLLPLQFFYRNQTELLFGLHLPQSAAFFSKSSTVLESSASWNLHWSFPSVVMWCMASHTMDFQACIVENLTCHSELTSLAFWDPASSLG